ncbi:hypothetical protein KA005_70725 [bacterium]|nr:hypothetical protein [bacterium]
MSIKKKTSPESIIRDIKRKTRRKFTDEEKEKLGSLGYVNKKRHFIQLSFLALFINYGCEDLF